MKPISRKIVSVCGGSILIASAVHFFILPYQIIEGGMIGIGLLTSYVSSIPSGVAIFLLSIPIYTFTWFVNKSLIWYNLTGIIIITSLLNVLDVLPNQPLFSPLNSALIGGLLIGVGVGILLNCNITTDGIDLLANLFSHKTKINVGILIFALDIIILCGGMFVLNRDEIILSGITVTAVGFVTTLLTMNNHKVNHTHNIPS
ncbi:YitT family protein [Paenibacillus abyssi]|uniref:YitT family protein n=1 Tax=Paenibacillus abyssi TaxID=1340531 RepID=A0A917D8D6_9BACL|nr:YitT family protein [Paenibacillus abyssi]GGG13189.1 hypothetical protein GCM10010916_32640 [Paenibacillus abyssi]